MTRAAFIIDPLNALNIKKDSTLAMIWAAQRAGWEVSVAEPSDLAWREGQSLIQTSSFELAKAPDELAREPGLQLSSGPAIWQATSEYDVIFMRKDPPFDMDYINTTYFLEQAELSGTLVVNSPSSLRDCNEKFFTTTFSDLIPPQVISREPESLLAFHKDHGDVVFKPLDGMGGKGIFRATKDDPNIHVIIETLTNFGQTAIVGQRFIPEINEGDKRILLIDGEPVPYLLARIPQKGETRGNLAAGGLGEARPLSTRDREIAEAVAPELKRRYLIFTGIDVIGDYLTEVNVTCPTCIREIDRAFDLDIAMDLINCIAAKIS